SDTDSTQDTTNRATEPKYLTTPTDLVVGKHHVAAAHKPTKSAKNKAAAAHDNLLTTTTPLPYSFQFYTSSIPSKPQHCVKASKHSKIHATCFAWYRGFCPFGNKKEVGKKNGNKDNNGKKKKQKGKNKCRYLHAVTEPPSYVQPPRGYVHGKEDKHHNSNNEAEVEEIKTEDSNMKEENTLLASTAQLTQDTHLVNTAQCTLDWCPGDWLWDHDHDDNHSHNHSSPEEETLGSAEEEILDSADITDSTVKISKNHCKDPPALLSTSPYPKSI
ncbi:hypothetical protein KCU73_g12522, partial [Aureobasidium melanogenum]